MPDASQQATGLPAGAQQQTSKAATRKAAAGKVRRTPATRTERAESRRAASRSATAQAALLKPLAAGLGGDAHAAVVAVDPAEERAASPVGAGESGDEASELASEALAGPFSPSEAQRKVLMLFLGADERLSIRELCRLAGIHSSTFYRWMHKRPFREWWNERTEQAMRGARSVVLQALTRRAEEGDLNAIKVWLARFDRVENSDQQTNAELFLDLLQRFLDRQDAEAAEWVSEEAPE